MCKYCETDLWNHCTQTWMGEEICDGRYEGCRIIKRDDVHYIQLTGSYETLSDPIIYCPFCGRKLE